MIRVERKLQTLKEILSQSPDFNLVDAFRLLTKQASDEILDKMQLKDFLANKSANSINLSNEDLYLLMRRLDKEFKGYASFEEFAKLFIPLDERYSSVLL